MCWTMSLSTCIIGCQRIGLLRANEYKQDVYTLQYYLPPLHSPVVRLTCNQQVLSSNLRGGSTSILRIATDQRKLWLRMEYSGSDEDRYRRYKFEISLKIIRISNLIKSERDPPSLPDSRLYCSGRYRRGTCPICQGTLRSSESCPLSGRTLRTPVLRSSRPPEDRSPG